MRKILIFLVFCFQTDKLFAQPPSLVEQIDSVFESIHVSDSDWLIGLTIDQAGTIPIYDSLGNIIYESPQGTFFLLKIGKENFLQKILIEYENAFSTKITMGKRLKLDKNINYLTDSILLANKEWIYPFVYKDDTDNAYNVQSPANHEPYYKMYFKTLKIGGCYKFFEETSLAELEPFLPDKNKNLNYLYNSGTFIYRSYVNLLSLIKANMKYFTTE